MNCFNCKSAIFCETFGEIKCLKKERVIYDPLTTECEYFDKRTKGRITDTPCQCDDCLSRRGEE